MDKPSRKIEGGQRFNGRGQPKHDPRPGTVQFYKYHFPDRFNNTAIAVRNSTGFSQQDCEVIAARVLKWNESPLAHMRFDNPEGKMLRDYMKE